MLEPQVEKYPVRVLVVTNMLPVADAPHVGRFVQQQIEALRRIGLEIEVLFVNRREKGMRVYAHLPILLRRSVATFNPDLVHVMYGGIMARLRGACVDDRPVVVTFHGSDLR